MVRENSSGPHSCSPCQATKLKEEEETLLKQHWELQALEAERKLKDEQRKKVELG